VLFHTCYLNEKGYGTPEYMNDHPQLSKMLIRRLVETKVSLIGIDTRGIRKPSEHIQADQYCASNDIFVIENLDNLDKLLNESMNKAFIIHTYPIAINGWSGLSSRVIAEIK
jgi:kynurenine formamidase